MTCIIQIEGLCSIIYAYYTVVGKDLSGYTNGIYKFHKSNVNEKKYSDDY